MQLKQESVSPAPSTAKKPPPAPAFPSARYFQIHFEHLHEVIQDLQQHVAESNQQIVLLQQRLDAMAAKTGRDTA